MQRTTPKKFRSLLAITSVLALVLSACGNAEENGPEVDPLTRTSSEKPSDEEPLISEGLEQPEDEEGADAESGSESEDESDAGDSDDAEANDEAQLEPSLPTKVIEAGKVTPGTTKSASGEKDALVVFEQSDSFAVVAEFECSECKGDIEIQQLGSHYPLDTGKKSLRGKYLLDIIGSADDEQTLIVRADGDWDVKFFSWNDLPIASGEQKGKGAEVLYIGDATTAIEVVYEPPKGGGKLSVTATSAVEKDGDLPKVVTISGGKKFTKKKDIKLPGVLTISGKGSWTIKLIS